MNPGATTRLRTSRVSRAARGSVATAAMRPPRMATLRTASSCDSGSSTRPPVSARSYCRLGAQTHQRLDAQTHQRLDAQTHRRRRRAEVNRGEKPEGGLLVTRVLFTPAASAASVRLCVCASSMLEDLLVHHGP